MFKQNILNSDIGFKLKPVIGLFSLNTKQ